MLRKGFRSVGNHWAHNLRLKIAQDTLFNLVGESLITKPVFYLKRYGTSDITLEATYYVSTQMCIEGVTLVGGDFNVATGE